MKRTIVIDEDSYMSSVSLLEDGHLIEFHIDYPDSGRLTGNIYKGKVDNVLYGLESAFVNIGRGRNGFLYVGETLENRADLNKVVPKLLDIKTGDNIMVQVTKEEIGQKGARLTANISIPGRYVVFLPSIDFVGISSKIVDPDRRMMLGKLLEKHKPEGGGLIARTVCIDAKKSDIVSEIKRIQAMYDKLLAAFNSEAFPVGLLHSEVDLVYRSMRDLLSSDVDKIVCNEISTFNRLKELLKQMKSDFYNKVELYEGKRDIWDVYGISEQVDKLLGRKVTLPSGGSLYIDHTEALTAIDVNTGSFNAGTDHEETVYFTNMEAAKEIARQLRLRNIGGIIVVDFIDMLNPEHKAAVVEALRIETLRDRIKTRVQDMTQLGLVEMTRKKVGKELSAKLLEPCAHCRNSGVVPNSDYLARKLRAAINHVLSQRDYENLTITMNPMYIDGVFSKPYFKNYCQRDWRDKRIYLIPDQSVGHSDFVIKGNDDAYLSLPASARLLY